MAGFTVLASWALEYRVAIVWSWSKSVLLLKRQIPRAVVCGGVWPHVARPLLVLTLEDWHPYDQVVQRVNQIAKE